MDSASDFGTAQLRKDIGQHGIYGAAVRATVGFGCEPDIVEAQLAKRRLESVPILGTVDNGHIAVATRRDDPIAAGAQSGRHRQPKCRRTDSFPVQPHRDVEHVDTPRRRLGPGRTVVAQIDHGEVRRKSQRVSDLMAAQTERGAVGLSHEIQQARTGFDRELATTERIVQRHGEHHGTRTAASTFELPSQRSVHNYTISLTKGRELLNEPIARDGDDLLPEVEEAISRRFGDGVCWRQSHDTCPKVRGDAPTHPRCRRECSRTCAVDRFNQRQSRQGLFNRHGMVFF